MYSHQEWTRALYWANLSDSKLILMSLTEHRFKIRRKYEIGEGARSQSEVTSPMTSGKNKKSETQFQLLSYESCQTENCVCSFFFFCIYVYTQLRELLIAEKEIVSDVFSPPFRNLFLTN